MATLEEYATAYCAKDIDRLVALFDSGNVFSGFLGELGCLGFLISLSATVPTRETTPNCQYILGQYRVNEINTDLAIARRFIDWRLVGGAHHHRQAQYPVWSRRARRRGGDGSCRPWNDDLQERAKSYLATGLVSTTVQAHIGFIDFTADFDSGPRLLRLLSSFLP